MAVDISQLKFNEQGLIPAIAQDRLTGEVRMMAWMNKEAIEATLSTGKATFFSRSRQSLWVKGESSNNFLAVSELLADCDADTLLILCDPAGPSCHTGADNCFFQPVTAAPAEDRVTTEGQLVDPARPFAQRLESVLEARKQSNAEKSYTRSLFEKGAPKINEKIIEEAAEVSQAILEESDERVASEAADVVFHLLVGLRFRNVSWRQVLEVLAGRFGVGGHVEKAARKKG